MKISWLEIAFYALLLANIGLRIYKRIMKKKREKNEKEGDNDEKNTM